MIGLKEICDCHIIVHFWKKTTYFFFRSLINSNCVLKFCPFFLTINHNQKINAKMEWIDKIFIIKHSAHFFEVGIVLIIVQSRTKLVKLWTRNFHFIYVLIFLFILYVHILKTWIIFYTISFTKLIFRILLRIIFCLDIYFIH